VDLVSVITIVALIGFAGFLAASESALTSISRVLIEELESKRGGHLLKKYSAQPARFLNVILLVRKVCEFTAAVLILRLLQQSYTTGYAYVYTVIIMVVLSYVVIGVGPRTMGRQNPHRWARAGIVVSAFLALILGPVTKLLIAVGNAITPGKGFRSGPFTNEAELRSRFHLGDARVLMFPAMTHPHKNHEFVLRMLAGPWRDYNLKLVMAGGHGLADTHVNQMIVELGVEDHAIRIGRVGANDRDGLIRLAEALVFPSMYEGFGAPVVEAMALGTPVIASDCASLPEVVGDAGLVLPLEESAWADALNEVGRRRAELIARGQTRSAQFTSAKSAEDLCIAYDAALTLSRAGRS